ncbi:MAG: patatin-like phospholipase family protein [Bacteroidota bacterium]
MRYLVFVLGVLLAMPAVAWAQPLEAAPGDSVSAPRLGVALSGGGARGFAHIGVLQVLEEVGVPIQAVAGSSMGSIVGGLYAAGYAPDSIATLVVGQDWTALFTEDTGRRERPLERRSAEDHFLVRLPLRGVTPFVPSGLTNGQQVYRLLTRLLLPVADIADFRELPVPYVAVATDLISGQAVRLEQGRLPDAIRASIAIPGVFTPVVLDGRTLVDGGVARNIPAEDALALGAEALVCVNVGLQLEDGDMFETLGDLLGQTIFLRGVDGLDEQAPLCTVLIEPDLTAFTAASYDQAAAIIAQGRQAAEAQRAVLERLAAESQPLPRQRPAPALPDSFQVLELEVTGETRMGDEGLVEALRVAVPATYTLADIETVADRVSSLGLYSEVTYRLEPLGLGYRLVLQTREARDGYVGLGVRYEGKYNTALLLGGLFVDPMGQGGTLAAVLRVGELGQGAVVYTRPLSVQPFTALRVSGRGTSFPIDQYEDGTAVSQLETNVLEVDVVAQRQVGGSTPSRALIAGLGLQAEAYNNTLSLGTDLREVFDRGVFRWGTVGRLDLDTFDRTVFASRGHRLMGRSFITLYQGQGGTFSTHLLDWEARWPWTNRLSVRSRFMLGRSFGPPPPHYQFRMGGAFAYGLHEGRQFPLLGFSVQELAGPHLQAALVGAQLRIRTRWYAQLQVNAAHLSETWSWQPDLGLFEWGGGLGAGVDTPFLPIEATLMFRGLDGPYALRIGVGHAF